MFETTTLFLIPFMALVFTWPSIGWKSIGEIDESQSLTTSVSSNGGSVEVSLVEAIDWS